MRLRVFVALSLLVAGAAGAAEPPPAGRGTDHPLTGQIWDVGAARFIAMDKLVERLAAARFILLGERHDHAEQHAFQAWIVRGLVGAGRRPAVAFEMLGADQAAALAQYLARSPHDAAGLGDAVGWANSGWPAWREYQPIAEAALAAGLPIVAANLPAGAARAVVRGDLSVLDPALVRAHALDRPAAPETQRAMEREIRDAHCAELPESMVPSMVTAQRARDAHMAERLLATQRDGAILIAGSGHVRTDRGVPFYLAPRAPGATIASLAFIEVADGRVAPSDYAERYGAPRLPFDYVWFTTRADDADPCAKLRKPGN
jgi:uncharacterized iron-regulated protein